MFQFKSDLLENTLSFISSSNILIKRNSNWIEPTLKLILSSVLSNSPNILALNCLSIKLLKHAMFSLDIHYAIYINITLFIYIV